MTPSVRTKPVESFGSCVRASAKEWNSGRPALGWAAVDVGADGTFPAEVEWGDLGTGPGQVSSEDCGAAGAESESAGLNASRVVGEAQPVSATREQTSVVSSGRDGEFMRRLQFV